MCGCPLGSAVPSLVLYRALRSGADMVARGEIDPAVVEAEMARVVARAPAVALDYAAVVDADDLEPARTCAARPLRLLIAAAVGPVRLIDNLDPHGPEPASASPLPA